MISARIWALSLSTALFACNSSDFKGAGGKQPTVEKKQPEEPAVTTVTPPVKPPPKPGTTTPNTNPQPPTEPPPPGVTPEIESFAIAQSEGEIDMVWLIDNSGSMKEEASQVRDNFDRFLTTIQARSDMKIALISNTDKADAIGGSTGVTLPFSAEQAGGIQIDSYVDSTNALMLGALATCPASTSNLPSGSGDLSDLDAIGSTGNGGKTCGKDLAPDFFSAELYKDLPGRLTSFFRPNAKKVYVVVTDDNADTVNDTNFLDMIQPYQGALAPTVFAFIGFENKEGCDIAQRGTAYEALAQKTDGGAVFDICEKDWSKNFDKLSKAVLGLAQAQFTLKVLSVKSIVSVVVDGKTLGTNAYNVTGNILALDPKAVPAGAKTVVVTYVK